MSWFDAGSMRPVLIVSAAYFFLSKASLAYSSSFRFCYYSNLFCSSSSSFLFLGGIIQWNSLCKNITSIKIK
jgi:hypothetical protein